MPEEGIEYSHRTDLLSYEEIFRLVSIFSNLGINKLRITGGEPFVRKDISYLIKKLSSVIPNLYITTNATLIHNHIELIKSYVKGLNISIDSLDPINFQMITKRNSFDQIFKNIKLCRKLEIAVKLNMVVLRGINDHEISPFLDFCVNNNIEIRFIEAMPFNDFDGNHSLFVSAKEIEEIIRSANWNLRKITNNPNSAADEYSLEEKSRIGIIPAYARSLCGNCNRIRLTATGNILTCLYAKSGLNLRDVLRNKDYSDAMISELIVDAVMNKKKNGYAEEPFSGTGVLESMTTIGG